MLIMAWFKTWNSDSRSKTKSRKTVMVISFSGSSRTCPMSASRSSSRGADIPTTYIALEQSSQLVLNHLGFSEQSLVDR